MTGCASPEQSHETLWSARSSGSSHTQNTDVTFIGGTKPLTARASSSYRHYRIIPRQQYVKYHIPLEAYSAFVGQDHVNYDVLYAVDTGHQWKIYGFTFGKFDIDWPPVLLGHITKR